MKRDYEEWLDGISDEEWWELQDQAEANLHAAIDEMYAEQAALAAHIDPPAQLTAEEIAALPF